MKLAFALRMALAWASLGAPAGAETLLKFPQFPPNKTNYAPSPDHQFIVRNEDRNREPNHALYLMKTNTNAEFFISFYRRHVDISWAPDSRYFFVNDYAGSDEADCFVVNPVDSKKEYMTHILTSGYHPALSTTEAGVSHLYVTCSTWRAHDSIIVSASGYGGSIPGGVNKKFIFDVPTGQVLEIR